MNSVSCYTKSSEPWSRLSLSTRLSLSGTPSGRRWPKARGKGRISYALYSKILKQVSAYGTLPPNPRPPSPKRLRRGRLEDQLALQTSRTYVCAGIVARGIESLWLGSRVGCGNPAVTLRPRGL